MAEENTGASVVNADDATALRRQVEELTSRLAALEGASDVAHFPAQGEAPRYRLNNNCYLEDDTLHAEGEELDYLGVPNDEMVPMNEVAKKRWIAWNADRTEEARRVADAAGRPFSGLITDKALAIAQATQDARRAAAVQQVVSMPQEKGVVPVMPHHPEAEAQRRRRGQKAALVGNVQQPPKAGRPSPTPIPVLGKDYTAAAARSRG